MKDTDVSTPALLEARLAIGGMRKHAHLRKIAEGRFSWSESVGLIAAVLLVVIGLVQFGRLVGVTDFMRSGVVFVVSGLVLLVSFFWSNVQRQQKALLELIKRLEPDRS